MGAEAAADGVAAHQALHVTHIAAAAQRVQVVADKAVAGVAGVAVFAAQHMAIHTQAHANAGAPGEVGAVVQRLAVLLQRAPAPLGLQRGDAVVFDPHPRKVLTQRRFQPGAGPTVGQTARRAGQAAADVRRRQLDQALLHDEGPTGGHAHGRDVRQAYATAAAALANQPQNLRRQGTLVAGADGGLGHTAVHAGGIGHTDRHLGAANVHAGHRAGACRESKVSAEKFWAHLKKLLELAGRRGSGAAVDILQAHDVVFAQIGAKLHFNDFHHFAARVGQAVYLTHGDVHMLAWQ